MSPYCIHTAENDKNNAVGHFCCICAPDAGDGAAICGANEANNVNNHANNNNHATFDLAAQIQHFATTAHCTRDRRLGPRGTFGVCSYQCACGRTDVMRTRCGGVKLKDGMTDKWETETLTDLRREDERSRNLSMSSSARFFSSSASSTCSFSISPFIFLILLLPMSLSPVLQ